MQGDQARIEVAISTVETIRGDLTVVKGSLGKLEESLVTLAVFGERQKSLAEALGRAFAAIAELGSDVDVIEKNLLDKVSEMDRRVREMEKQQPTSTMTTNFVVKSTGWVLAAVVGAFFSLLMTTLLTRDKASQQTQIIGPKTP